MRHIIIFLNLLAAVAAAGEAPSPLGSAPPVVATAGCDGVVELHLDGQVPGVKGNLVVRLFRSGGAITACYGLPRLAAPYEAKQTLHDGIDFTSRETGNVPLSMACQLTQAGGGWTGWVRRSGERGWYGPRIDVAISGEAGTWSAEGGKGRLTARQIPVKQLAEKDPVRPGYGWPRYEGIDGHGAARAIERPVVEALADARFVWKSEARFPLYYCGASTPVVEGDLLVLNWYEPAGDVVMASGGRKFSPEKDPGDIPWNHQQRCLVRADDVVVGVDTATGLTRWRTVLPLRAGNFQNDQKIMPGNCPTIADGRVYVAGFGGQVYALDAATGKLLWEADLGWASQRVREAIAKAVEKREIPRPPAGNKEAGHVDGALQSRPAPLDGVVAFNAGSSGVWAFDGATGKLLWEDGEARHGWRGSVRVHREGGKAWFAYLRKGTLAIVEPRTGQRVRELPLPQPFELFQVWNGLLVTTNQCKQEWKRGRNAVTVPAKVQAWRIGATALEPAYSLDVDGVNGADHNPVICDGRLIFGGHRDNIIACIDAATGRNLGPLTGTDGQGAYFELSAGYDRVFRPSFSLAMTAIAPGAGAPKHETGHILGYGYEASSMDVALADGRLFVRDADGLVCWDLRR